MDTRPPYLQRPNGLKTDAWKESSMEGFVALIMENPVIFWLIVAVASGVVEALTAGLVSIWFSAGALIAMLPAALGASFNFQIAVFIAASAAALFFTRPFLKRVLRVKKTPTNADQVIGMRGVVVSPVDNIRGGGRVLANGLEWEARTLSGTRLEEGEVVVVKELRGVTLFVEKI